MVAWGHTAAGAAIGLTAYQLFGTNLTPIEGLFLAGTMGFLSHYLLDFMPHGHFIKSRDFQKKVFAVIAFDLALSVLLFTLAAYYAFGTEFQVLYILFGIGGSQLPDILDALIYLKKLPKVGPLKLEYNYHQWLHWHGREDNGLPWGIRDIWQISVIIVALLFLFIQ